MNLQKLTTIAFFLALFVAVPVLASETDGTIDPSHKHAWGENLGWINFACDECDVQVTDSGLTGYSWSAAAGWINLSPADGGVTNDVEGNLGGYAWSTNKGWIDMSGVTIDSSGQFTGTAGTEGSAAGRINFDCDNCSVVTDWRPEDVRGQDDGTGEEETESSGELSDKVRISNFQIVALVVVIAAVLIGVIGLMRKRREDQK